MTNCILTIFYYWCYVHFKKQRHLLTIVSHGRFSIHLGQGNIESEKRDETASAESHLSVRLYLNISYFPPINPVC